LRINGRNRTSDRNETSNPTIDKKGEYFLNSNIINAIANGKIIIIIGK
jgi:hypothetical protein